MKFTSSKNDKQTNTQTDKQRHLSWPQNSAELSERGLVKIPVVEAWKREKGSCERSRFVESLRKMALFSDPGTQDTIENELEIVKKTLSEKVEGTEIISCHPVAVNVRIT